MHENKVSYFYLKGDKLNFAYATEKLWADSEINGLLCGFSKLLPPVKGY